MPILTVPVPAEPSVQQASLNPAEKLKALDWKLMGEPPLQHKKQPLTRVNLSGGFHISHSRHLFSSSHLRPGSARTQTSPRRVCANPHGHNSSAVSQGMKMSDGQAEPLPPSPPSPGPALRF